VAAQAVSSSSSKEADAPATQQPQHQQATYISIAMHSVQVKLMMDRVTGTAQVPSIKCQPVAHLLLLDTAASYGPAGGANSAGMPVSVLGAGGNAITCRIGHIAVQDLQAAVEHRHVLTYNVPTVRRMCSCGAGVCIMAEHIRTGVAAPNK
jgi:hypothetical protein